MIGKSKASRVNEELSNGREQRGKMETNAAEDIRKEINHREVGKVRKTYTAQKA